MSTNTLNREQTIEMVVARPLAESDTEKLREFHQRLSPETIRYRFFTPVPDVSAKMAEWFCSPDGENRVAIAAFCEHDLIGVARFDRLENSRRAEWAIVVEDAWQGLGVGTWLLGLLAKEAKDVGIETFEASVLADNRRCLNLAQKVLGDSQKKFSSGVLELATEL